MKNKILVLLVTAVIGSLVYADGQDAPAKPSIAPKTAASGDKKAATGAKPTIKMAAKPAAAAAKTAAPAAKPAAKAAPAAAAAMGNPDPADYVVNKNSNTMHKKDCGAIKDGKNTRPATAADFSNPKIKQHADCTGGSKKMKK